MSTFKGIVAEFPRIRIDYFRKTDNHQPPLACFLSHVHSDHLLGLESLKAPFVYCSPATREILLRLEKYPSRMNFAKGILETRLQTYKHLKNILKTIPSETPTVIELYPGHELRVTLFDANHCIGAVMFLIEGDGKAILYTGDIRSESWWVNSLVRNPVLLPYASGIKRLDNIYLDTTFATKEQLYREFPSKAEGLKELLAKVAKYSKDTLFYVHSWTFGYEDVWIAMAALLGTRVHLDPYRWGLYGSLDGSRKSATQMKGLNGVSQNDLKCTEVPQLLGYKLGNHQVDGCLTPHTDARIHSCERGGVCEVMSQDNFAVMILPVVTRRDGQDVHELGAGGGKGDMDQVQEVDVQDAAVLNMFLELCEKHIRNAEMLDKVTELLLKCHKSHSARMQLQRHIREKEIEDGMNATKLEELVEEIVNMIRNQDFRDTSTISSSVITDADVRDLPRLITFPYSRHSSYSELCELVAAFNPRDIYPCTVDEENWTPHVSMETLFGHVCISENYEHDNEMMIMYRDKLQMDSQGTEDQQETQRSFLSMPSSDISPSETSQSTQVMVIRDIEPSLPGERIELGLSNIKSFIENKEDDVVSPPPARRKNTIKPLNPIEDVISAEELAVFEEDGFLEKPATPLTQSETESSSSTEDEPITSSVDVVNDSPLIRPFSQAHQASQLSSMKRKRDIRDISATPTEKKSASIRQQAYWAARKEKWDEFGGLVCTRASQKEVELGSDQSFEEL